MRKKEKEKRRKWGGKVRRTQQWDGLQHGTDLIQRTLGLAAFVVVAAEAVDPRQQPSSLGFSFSVKLLQQLGGNREVFLETFCSSG